MRSAAADRNFEHTCFDELYAVFGYVADLSGLKNELHGPMFFGAQSDPLESLPVANRCGARFLDVQLDNFLARDVPGVFDFDGDETASPGLACLGAVSLR